MPVFVVKARLENTILPPITVACADEEEAISMVRRALLGDPNAKVESKGQRPDIMKAAFGDQPNGTIVIRQDWTWSPLDGPMHLP